MKTKQIVYEWGDVLKPTKQGVENGIARPSDYAYFIKYGKNDVLRLLVVNKATIESHHSDFWEILPK